MTIFALESILTKNGYEYLEDLKLEEIKVFYQSLNDRILVIMALELKENMNLNSEDFLKLQNKVKGIFASDYCAQLFCLVFTADIEKARSFTSECQECWIYDMRNKKTIIFENQSANFYGLYEILETNIENWGDNGVVYSEPDNAVGVKKKPIITLSLIIINILVFVLLEYLGSTDDAEFMAVHGALYMPYIQEGKEYYRLFTSMFMHFGIDHLLNNMLMLFVVGEILEKQIGKIFYVVIYLVSGIGASLISYWYYLKEDMLVVSAGASGAIFGIVGALLIAVILNRGKLESVTTSRMLFMIGLSLYLGFTELTTNNAAHIGGLLFGVVLGAIIIPITISKRKKN